MSDSDDPSDPQLHPIPGMSEPYDVSAEPPVGAPTPPPRRGAARRTVVVAAVAVGVAAGGGAIALAAGGGSTGTRDAASTQRAGRTGGAPDQGGDVATPASGSVPTGSAKATPSARRPGGGSRAGGWGGEVGVMGALHGQFTVTEQVAGTSSSTVTPTYVVEDTQRGTVTALTASTVTVKSADGYSATYTLPASTASDDHTVSRPILGDAVSVIATVSGGAATMTSLHDQTQAKAAPGSSTTASPSTTATPSAGASTAAGGAAPAGGPPGGGGPGGSGGGGDRGLGLGLGQVVHGTYVLASTTGSTTSYVTDVTQTGKITALSATSVSLLSADGYRATYVVGTATRKATGLTTGAQVTVVATGRPASATLLQDTQQFAEQPGADRGGPGFEPGSSGTSGEGAQGAPPAADGGWGGEFSGGPQGDGPGTGS